MSQPDKLSLVSYLAPNMFGFYEAVGAYLSRVVGIETQLVQSQYDPLEDPMMLQDQLDIAFICGLPFARRHRDVTNQLQALVAPVMQASRYQESPVYFSDMIVNAQSNLLSFHDLGGATFCYNDPGSNSGYNLVHQRLIEGGYPSSFFGKVIQSGSHQQSIRQVVDGLADCAAIDSTVLEQELRDCPELSNHLRVIDSIGPCPMPPVVAAQHLGTQFLDTLQSALCQPDTELQLAMERSHIRHYVAVESEDYQVLATMYDRAIQAGYEAIA
ncbi:MAG TPA: phosphate ABC transporter substrate-binding protein [Cyanobacteria bacterium UBA8553]|nr:phosphate ABC transporter substrate-binding protein [Cyanobacteria bacterium UBA8553]HAJ63686.1 phosphate ABC transporter substrate-binding protein [Cyanobacteria bacterium UBA8543]